MKKIYIVFIASNFKSGKFIRFATNSKYNHVAISFDPYITELYSYARYNFYEPLLGGFGKEYPNRYLADGKDVDIKVCEYPLSDNDYVKVKSQIEFYYLNRNETKYNFLSVIAYPFGRPIKIKYAYTCIEFVLELIQMNQIKTIKQLEGILRDKTVFQGKLSNRLGEDALIKTDDFYVKKNKIIVYGKTAVLLGSLVMLCFNKPV